MLRRISHEYASSAVHKTSWRDATVYVILTLIVAAVLLIYGKIIFDICADGAGEISMSYLVDPPRHSGRAGGIYPILVSTILVLGIAIAVALPVSLAIALYQTEYLSLDSKLSRLFRASMLVLASVPSIAFGIFGSVFFAQMLNLQVSILTGGLTLAVMILPICSFALEEIFRFFPIGYRCGAYALGASRLRVIFFVILPASISEIVSVVLLGIGRALAETAALLFTSGYSDRMPQSIFDPGRVLSVHIYDLAMNIPGGDKMASAGAILLIGLFLMISSVGIYFSKRFST